MRAFIGVPLPSFPDLRGLLDELRASKADLKLVRDDHLHLTLKFLGEIAEPQAQQILMPLKASQRPTSFPITVRDVGAFPDMRKLNILWAGLDDPQGGLARLQQLVETIAVGLGFPPEDRPFRPHLTLGRKRSEKGKEAAKEVLGRWRGHVFGEATIQRINFYRSTLTPEGPKYDVVGEVPL